MAQGMYTPLQLTAAAGLLSNVGIDVSSNLTSAVTSYNTIPTIASLLGTISLAGTYGLSSSVITQIKTLGASNCPALGDSVPTAYANTITPVQTAATIPTTTDAGFVQFVEDTGSKYLGDGDLSKFVTVYFSATGFQNQTAQIVYSTVNANKAAPTFTNTNDATTGNLTKVTLALPAFSSDLTRIGKSLSLAKIDELGTPASLLQQISLAAGIVRGTIASLDAALIKQGLTQDEIVRLCTPEQSRLNLTRTQFNYLQLKAYNAIGTITGTDLTDILNILDVTIPNITNLQDLLNPRKLFASSWPSLTVPTDSGPELLYQANGSINPAIQGFANKIQFGPNNNVTGCDELAKIIPQEQAVASVALAASLGQINNINSMNTATLAKAAASVETMKSLDQIESLTTPLPASVNTFFKNSVATGTGSFGIPTITDILGISAGVKVTGYINQVVAALGTINLSSLKAVYDNMLSCVQGTFGPVTGPVTIPSGPGTGVYATGDLAFTSGLLPAAVTAIANIVTAEPVKTTSMNDSFTGICQRIVSEAGFQAKAGINYDNTESAGQTAMYSFVSSLATIGAYSTPGGQAEYLIQVADFNTQAGQAIVGAIREGKNKTALNEAGIPVDSFTTSSNYPGDPTSTGVTKVVAVVSPPTSTVSNLNEPSVVPAPVEYQTTTNPTSTSYTPAAAAATVTGTASTTTTAPAVVKIDEVYLQQASAQEPGAISSTVLQDTAFWIKLRVYPSDANTQVTMVTPAGAYFTYPGVTLNSGQGVLLQVPGWLIPTAGNVNLVVTAGPAGGPTTADSRLINVAVTDYPKTVEIVQDGWFTSVNQTVYGNEVTVILRGPPSQTFIWGTTWTTLWPVGSGTFDSDGYAIFSGLSSPPISKDNQILVYYESGEIAYTSFTTTPM